MEEEQQQAAVRSSGHATGRINNTLLVLQDLRAAPSALTKPLPPLRRALKAHLPAAAAARATHHLHPRHERPSNRVTVVENRTCRARKAGSSWSAALKPCPHPKTRSALVKR